MNRTRVAWGFAAGGLVIVAAATVLAESDTYRQTLVAVGLCYTTVGSVSALAISHRDDAAFAFRGALGIALAATCVAAAYRLYIVGVSGFDWGCLLDQVILFRPQVTVPYLAALGVPAAWVRPDGRAVVLVALALVPFVLAHLWTFQFVVPVLVALYVSGAIAAIPPFLLCLLLAAPRFEA